ncbi:MAG: 30S ribosomal protein S17 [Elusimicrobia bacterium RIFOXYA1_FULL_47_7]|nr:MAG: 30S ribosomal protein S17 [Elusimicrobia bacterium RIFOXYA12_FULL_49_49]OGS06154.1 MAG: 30S ribosomal protein S17 [Elusimicrobia bacterium RIFOXYA1_FULL_47_7]OGS09463.1 MAG: 30S ribosomal protein S17 [Elusimicrobia bacterium RIFOXYB1_FULL_48_9]OGS14596.1 MAG: 30S ribosomal protein S17 [Elusimicrobia bacterium RIFOXYA2_FULL_47_53]OGS25769.1 MAG: 30S ribosomal protein S17 [Elusimicrobia bacterium RIFOXYB12_FULL_50_12]OGS31687.1 MAG: 30S ribosomal protein S17 [Elusimicrobia bacterium RIFO
MERNKRKAKVGIVIKDKMDKTRVVEVARVYRHKTYDKVMRRSTKFYVHDEKNESHIGDKVSIMETRPLSRLKRWGLVAILEKGQN